MEASDTTLCKTNPSDYCVIITSTDSQENAELITHTLLEKRLVACVQSGRIKSAYRWQGKVISEEEIRLELKSKVSLYERVKSEIEKIHIYDVPEILMLPVTDGNETYLKWIETETAAPVELHEPKEQTASK